MQLHTGIGVLLLLLGVSHAQLYEVHDGNEKDAWLAGVFTPQPLRAAPWQAPDEPAPTPMPAPQSPPSGGLSVPGVGELHGLRGFKLIKGRPIDAYLGVRYGQVNSGLGRFQPARTLPYQGRIDASQSSANCAQFPDLQRLQRAEALGENVDDCLSLNIYAPAGARELPVLVFVHGEMLFDGAAEEAQPDYVLEHDVLLVSINYRLAPFGFLSTLSDELPGNVALSDLQLALEWVQRNIQHFGGSPGQVTLVGQAGGATLAHALSLSPKTQHLFQQLILQSGTALNPYLIDERPLDTLATFAHLAHCPSPRDNAGRNLGPLYECLRRLRTSQLVSAFEQLLQQNEPRGMSALGGFKLVVGDRLGYLPEHPAALVASSSANNQTKPLIVGATKDASAFILSRFYDQIERLQSHNVSDYINVVLRHTAPADQHKIWHDWALREIFTPEQTRYVNARSVTQGLLELSNIILYRAPVIHSIRLAHKKTPVYLYTFDYRGEHHRFGHLNSPLPFGVDASLSDDSVYLFPYPAEVSNLNPEDKSLARALVAMWVNFAQSGVPNAATNVWPKATSEYGPFLRFTNSRHSILELDQHFGDGLDVPNVYGPYLNATNSTSGNASTTPQPPTRRPYLNNARQPYRPPQQQQQQLPEYGRQPAYNDYYERAQEHRRQQLLREQQELEQKLREQQEQEMKVREQQQRELQQREELQREEEERKREQQQRDEELQREQQQREQFEREQRQRAQEQREHEARQLQEAQEQAEGEREERENEMRRQHEREQQLRGQQEREQQESEQWQHETPEERDEQREQQQREQQEREQELRSQEEREQEAREQQQREQVAREQEERAQQPSAPEDDRQPNPSAYPTYEDYVKAYTQFIQEQESLYNPESYASAEEDALDEAGPDGHQMYSDAQHNPQRLRLMHTHRLSRMAALSH